jgi:hypothetical protein
VPVRFDGARWDTIYEKSQSSTWRERAAAMLITHRNRDCLSGRVFIVSDNKNLVGSWKNAESLTTSLCNAFQTYISHVHDAIHVKRSHPIIKWVDNSARNLPETLLAVKRLFDGEDGDDRKIKGFRRDDLGENLLGSSVDSDAHSEDGISSEPELSSVDESEICDQPQGESFNGHFNKGLDYLLEKGWIIRKDENFYTTDMLPGHVEPDSYIVPEKDAVDTLKRIHEDYGHPTASGMRKILNLWKIWVLNFTKIAKEVVSNCKTCLECRDTYHPVRSSIPMVKKPMEMIMADFLQPEKVTQPAFLLIRDRFSGFTEGRAVEKLDSFEVRQLLLEWISRFGPPTTFLTDNAEAFNAEIMQAVYRKYHIIHRKTPVYDPQANGSVERTVKTIEEGLRIELAVGSPPQEAIHIVCGRVNRTTAVPGDSTLSSPRSVVFKFNELNPFVPRSTRSFDFEHDLLVGQRVMLKIPNAGKLCKQFEDKGFVVSGIEGIHVYSLKDSNSTILKTLYRRERLKPLPTDLKGLIAEDNLRSLSWGEVCGII